MLWLNGQSNAEAFLGVIGDPSPIADYLGPDLLLWSDIDDAFVEAGDGGGNLRSYCPPNYPPDLSPGGGLVLTRLMRQLADLSGSTIRAIAHARSSHEIAYFERESVQLAQYGDNTTHAEMNNYELMLDCKTRSGRRVDLMIWCQGESDSGDSQAAYYAKIAPLFASYWADYGAPIVLISTINVAAVAAAQAQLAEERDYVHLQDNADMVGNATYYDGLHYTAAGYAKVADRIYAMLRREEEPGL